MTLRQPLHLILLPAALGLAAACVVPQAAANSGVITFTGETTAATCVVEGGEGQNLPSFTVALPPVSSALFVDGGDLAGRTRFAMRLRDCSGVQDTVRAHFEAGTTVDAATGTLRPSDGGPVHFALFDEDGVPIDVGNTHAGPGYAPDTTMYYEVAYQKVGAGPITPGTFTGSVAYTLQYD